MNAEKVRQGGLLSFLNAREGHRVELLRTGSEALSRLEALAGQARHEILLACYIVADDAVGRRIEKTLTDAVRRGVDVKVVIDGFGSLPIALDPWPSFRAAGGRIEVWEPFRLWKNGWGFWRRDHRKFLVIDGGTGLLGGMNLTEDYDRTVADGGMVDRAIELEGPGVYDLARLFDRTWSWITKEKERPRTIPPPVPGGVRVAIEGNGKFRDRHRIARAYREAIRAADQSIVLENPYFLPDRGIRRHMRNALRRGVSVTAVLPQATDARFVDLASRALWGRLREAGVALHIDPAFLHAKLALFDLDRVILGSCNLDHRSLFHNLEVVAFVESPGLAGQIREEVDRDLSRSTLLDLDAWKKRPRLERWIEHLLFGFRLWF